MKEVEIAYIGGGSRGWARQLMRDLVLESRISGNVRLYDIDYPAALDNQTIGNKFNECKGAKTKWNYTAVKTIGEALSGADVVVISILPGTFDEMAVDVHMPEELKIYQSVGDTVGVGGVIRSLRTIPMMAEIARNVKKYCPKAWVINYTNPMAVCVGTLYKAFPEIKAYGCCHEIYLVQELIANIYNKAEGTSLNRRQVDVNVLGVNHFTWITQAHYKDVDLMPYYREFVESHPYGYEKKDNNWMNSAFETNHKVKFDLFRRYGYIAAAGDRHLAEFCPANWYLKNPELVWSYGFGLTPVKYRTDELAQRYETTKQLLEWSTDDIELWQSDEEGVIQICALMGEGPLISNVNLPNRGQIPNLPMGAVVETNAYFCGDTLTPLLAGNCPEEILPLEYTHAVNQKLLVEAGMTGDYDKAFKVFVNCYNSDAPLDRLRSLFDKMLDATKEYLPFYDVYISKKSN